ncbi:MAG: hypothetical protein ACHQ06_02655 [Candidatus Dormibacteria bacterium]|jgi:hypothetical protein
MNDNPLGVGGLRLHDWASATRSFGQVHGTHGYECVERVHSPAVAHLRSSRVAR